MSLPPTWPSFRQGDGDEGWKLYSGWRIRRDGRWRVEVEGLEVEGGGWMGDGWRK